MRRQEREISEDIKIDEIIRRCDICRIGLWDGEEVYIVPLNFGYENTEGERVFYFHGAKKGRKYDIITKTDRASFELDCSYELCHNGVAAECTSHFQSIMGTGKIELVDDFDEKIKALTALMFQNTGETDFTYPPQLVERTAIIKLTVQKISCKENS